MVDVHLGWADEATRVQLVSDGPPVPVTKGPAFHPRHLQGHRYAKSYRKRISKARRQRVYERDGFACVECGSEKKLSIDHKVPITRGGTNEESNLQTMRKGCNNRKGNRLPKAPSAPLRGP